MPKIPLEIAFHSCSPSEAVEAAIRERVDKLERIYDRIVRCEVVVETPQSLTKQQRELLKEFERLSSRETQPEAAGFFGKVKDFFGNRAAPS